MAIRLWDTFTFYKSFCKCAITLLADLLVAVKSVFYVVRSGKLPSTVGFFEKNDIFEFQVLFFIVVLISMLYRLVNC